MKTAYGCKLFGAHQALAGIRDAVILFHSVVGCNYGTMLFHLSPCNQTDVRQTSTIISDPDIIFGGEESLRRALLYTKELYHPGLIFVITGCVSDMIQDDVKTIVREFEQETQLRTIAVEAAGYRGGVKEGYEEALLCLIEEMRIPDKKQPAFSAKEEKGRQPEAKVPAINIMGIGADDRNVGADLSGLERLLNGKAGICCCFASCTLAEIQKAADADLNLVFGRGLWLAEEMEKRFGIPYEQIDFPYGYTGAAALWDCLTRYFSLDYTGEKETFRKTIKEKLKTVYTFLEILYGKPVSVIGEGSRARGLARFLSDELGMEVEKIAERDQIQDLGECFAGMLRTETAVLFGSSFEQELADEMGIPLVCFDYPVFDRFSLTERPYVGIQGELCLMEDIFNEICRAKQVKGPLYR